MADKDINDLIKKAKQVMKNAFVPSCKFPVGVAIITDNGNVYQGCNVESVIGGMGTCAERAAITNAVSKGEYHFKSVVIVSNSEKPLKPCGMCLQWLAEFAQVANHDIEIIMVGSNGVIVKNSVRKMLPDTIGPRDLGLDLTKYE